MSKVLIQHATQKQLKSRKCFLNHMIHFKNLNCSTVLKCCTLSTLKPQMASCSHLVNTPDIQVT